MKSIYFLFLLVVVYLPRSNAQNPPFYDEIQAFKKQDSIKPPPQHAILFVGSSSFHFWTDVQDYFPGYPIINRGFGGSSLPDVIRYANDIIFPYHPKQIVIPQERFEGKVDGHLERLLDDEYFRADANRPHPDRR